MHSAQLLEVGIFFSINRLKEQSAISFQFGNSKACVSAVFPTGEARRVKRRYTLSMARARIKPSQDIDSPEQRNQLPLIAIVGRPNAGKSTFFNRLSHQRKAVVNHTPGVTRDRNFIRAEWGQRHFVLVDTGGIDPSETAGVVGRVQAQTQLAIEEADAIIFLLDGKEGLNPADTQAVDLLRRSEKPVFFAVNKIDVEKHEAKISDFFSLGIEPLFPMSAAHGRGIPDLLDAVLESVQAEAESVFETEAFEPDPNQEPDQEFDQELDTQSGQEPETQSEPQPRPLLPVAIIGRPNVGKSSLLNRLVGFERSIVDSTPGTTRDAIDSLIEWQGQTFRLVDTAGVRRRPRVHEQVEQASVFIALKAVERAEVCLVVIDGVEGMTDQEARLIHYAWDRGRAVVLVVNKWDIVPTEGKDMAGYEKVLRKQFAVTLPLPMVFLSALSGAKVKNLLPMIARVAQAHAVKLPTVQLNRHLKEWTERTPPPSYKGRTPRFFYIAQVSSQPPVVAIYTSAPQGLTKGYARYLENRLREKFDLLGTPLRLSFRSRRKDRKPRK
jgi:GTP-binding protein